MSRIVKLYYAAWVIWFSLMTICVVKLALAITDHTNQQPWKSFVACGIVLTIAGFAETRYRLSKEKS